jgi:hypothetical protein
MNTESLGSNEKLERVEVNALEGKDEISPLDGKLEYLETPESVNEPNIEMSTCTCSGSCGSNYSYGDCTCSGNCGSNYHK